MSLPQQILQLEAYQHTPSLPEELTTLLYDTRQALRADPYLKSTYGSDPVLWNILERLWNGHATLLVSGDATVLRPLTSLASLLASLCAATPGNQVAALPRLEPHLRRVLLHSSSLVNLEDPSFTVMTRMCCQALSNLITDNEEVVSAYFPQRLALEESDRMLSRLLASTDRGTLQAILIFVLNSTADSPERAKLLSTSRAGGFLVDQILIISAAVGDEEDVPVNAEEDELFAMTYALVQQIIVLGAFPEIYLAQASPSAFVICDAQVTLLKFLDGYLQLPANAKAPAPPGVPNFLFGVLSSLSKDLQTSNRPKDARDAATIHGLLLILHCQTSIGLGTDAGRLGLVPIVPDVVATLRLVDTLVPSSTSADAWTEPQAIQDLKRSCVRLLGIAGFESKDAQDAIRETRGLTLLLGMCQINDKNPTLREHALFAIRNTLKNNITNQELVEGMTPQYLVGEGGALRDLPPAMR